MLTDATPVCAHARQTRSRRVPMLTHIRTYTCTQAMVWKRRQKLKSSEQVWLNPRTKRQRDGTPWGRIVFPSSKAHPCTSCRGATGQLLSSYQSAPQVARRTRCNSQSTPRCERSCLRKHSIAPGQSCQSVAAKEAVLHGPASVAISTAAAQQQALKVVNTAANAPNCS